MQYIMIDASFVNNQLPKRSAEMHKGDCGKLFMICGSLGMTGAPYFSAMGALRTGAGLVYLGVPAAIYEIEANKLNEPLVFPLFDHCGMLAKEAVSQIEERIAGKDAVLIGPGLGISEGTRAITEFVLKNYTGPVVLDADGINGISQNIDLLRERTGQTILTPHAGEFTRLGGDLSAGKIEGAVKLAQELDSIVLLKGHHTVITDGKTVYVNPTGNPGMAVGGSGDILAGIITALLGFGIAPLEAAACGAWLHGSAGDICADEIGEYGMLPTDMLHVLPRLLK